MLRWSSWCRLFLFYVVTCHVIFYTALWLSQMWAISQVLMIPLSTFSSKLWCFMERSYNIFTVRPLKGCSNAHHGLVCFCSVLLLVPFYFTWVPSSNVGNQPNCDDSSLTLSPDYHSWNFIQYICCASTYFQQWQKSCILYIIPQVWLGMADLCCMQPLWPALTLWRFLTTAWGYEQVFISSSFWFRARVTPMVTAKSFSR